MDDWSLAGDIINNRFSNMDEKLKFFGELNQGKEVLQRAEKMIADIWNDGNVRLTLDDIEDISKAEREIRGLIKQIGAFKELFLNIANGKVAEEIKNN